ncbi:MAG TPA: ABC transporter ATP-binding protein [Ktedonobacteraceae bacterium]|jgi:ABC-2 type transport system ATP-binding protein|nr:ABC transporter ATP-binding protein [Ktedonobacteraceae bacterium]
MTTTAEPAIVIQQLRKVYGNVQALKGISLSVAHGEIFGFLGPNGAGKTTAIRCMLDFLRPTAGTIRVLGLDAQGDSHALHQRVGYLPGDVRLQGDITGRQIINYFARLQGREPVLLPELVARFDIEMKRPIKNYSKGMRQKIGIALAFMCDPDVLILDEPTSGLDPLLQRTFNDLLLEEQARGKTIFMSSHIMSDIERVCQRVAVIRQGELVTVEKVETLREKAGQRVTVEFGDQVTEAEVAHLPGVSMIECINGTYHFNTNGSMDPLIKALSLHEVLRLHAEEAPLEEVFLKFYEEPAPASAGTH